jgi:hypothetical protein
VCSLGHWNRNGISDPKEFKRNAIPNGMAFFFEVILEDDGGNEA